MAATEHKDERARPPACPERDTAALMAKAFYREMANAGFPPAAIIGAAAAIIGELTHTLKHGEKRT